MIIDKGCWERGCACYDSRIDKESVNIEQIGWLRVMDEEMVGTHLGVANLTDSYEEAKAKLAAIIDWHCSLALYNESDNSNEYSIELFCPSCGVDRLKENCKGNGIDCPMQGNTGL